MVQQIIYVHQWPIPMLAANTIHTMKACQGYRRCGFPVTLFAPRPDPLPPLDAIWRQYGIREPFELRLHKGRLRSHVLFWQAAWFARQQQHPLLHTRNPAAALYSTLAGVPTVLEVHAPPGKRMARYYLALVVRQRQLRKVVAITPPLKAHYLQQYAPWLNDTKVHVEPDAVDLAPFAAAAHLQNRANQLRQALGYSPTDFIALYAGSLYKGRGIDFLGQLALAVPSLQFLIVGGTSEEVAHWQAQTPLSTNLRFHTAVPNAEIPTYLCMANVLLMPYAQQVYVGDNHTDTSRYASPMKMFEYMAAQRPIISSDLPVLHTVLNDRNALLCPPHALTSWQAALLYVRDNPEMAARLANQAFSDVQHYTWEKRAHRILEGLNCSER